MDKERILSMDPYVLLSLINMKLRDEFVSLDDFCLFNNITDEDILEKLKKIGYFYDENTNQFKAA
ncbi:DUF4250 domain-containing protein [Clostridium hydrogeniformans]|uniref:DUF4250 domain-containing protein n=1 Tax=Clostridium hydrogeniformans TaxID=349933 RepID=UPI000489863D|nr:DUF4250 domain-containing protein [Clostridium hydrogeniformans]